MKVVRRRLFVAMVLAVAVVSGCGPGPSAGPARWRYARVRPFTTVEKKVQWWVDAETAPRISKDATEGAAIDLMGAEGWELVAIIQASGDDWPTFYFKKPG